MKQSLKIQDGTRPEQLSLWAGSHNDHANRLVLPGSKEAQMMTDISGRKCLELYERSGQGGLLQKTFLAYLIGMPGWLSTRCYLTWKMKAIRRYHRLYFQLVPSMPRTEETEFSLLPTPDCSDRRSDNRKQWGLSNHAKNGLLPTPVVSQAPYQYSNGDKTRPVVLTSVGKMKAGLLPTPQARDLKDGSKTEDGRMKRKIEQGWSVNLNDMATSGMLPTPTASDNGEKNTGKRNQDGLQKRAYQATGQASQLNHRFVMEMMGFAPDWCDLYEETALIYLQKKKSTQSYQKRLVKSGKKE